MPGIAITADFDCNSMSSSIWTPELDGGSIRSCRIAQLHIQARPPRRPSLQFQKSFSVHWVQKGDLIFRKKLKKDATLSYLTIAVNDWRGKTTYCFENDLHYFFPISLLALCFAPFLCLPWSVFGGYTMANHPYERSEKGEITHSYRSLDPILLHNFKSDICQWI